MCIRDRLRGDRRPGGQAQGQPGGGGGQPPQPHPHRHPLSPSHRRGGDPHRLRRRAGQKEAAAGLGAAKPPPKGLNRLPLPFLVLHCPPRPARQALPRCESALPLRGRGGLSPNSQTEQGTGAAFTSRARPFICLPLCAGNAHGNGWTEAGLLGRRWAIRPNRSAHFCRPLLR